MKRAGASFGFVVLTVSALVAVMTLESADAKKLFQPTAADGPRRMGGYEVAENWPKPLPDTDLSHDGWTWGSGCGVWAESPDKVWICQRGEIELPKGAKPFTFAGLLKPPRTNTGRWPVLRQGAGVQASAASCRLCR